MYLYKMGQIPKHLVKRIFLTIPIIVLLILLFLLISSVITKYTGFSVLEGDGLDKCLKDNDITLYINSADSSEALKNIQLNNYLNNVKIINCFDNNQCDENGIDNFPAWIINGDKFVKDISIAEILEFL